MAKRKQIRFVSGGYDEKTEAMLNRVCNKLLRYSKKEWDFRETKKDGGILKRTLEETLYTISKKYRRSEDRKTGGCPVFGDGWDWVTDNYYDYTLIVSPSKGDSVVWEEKDVYDDCSESSIANLYSKIEAIQLEMKYEREDKAEEEEEELERKRQERKNKRAKSALEKILKKK